MLYDLPLSSCATLEKKFYDTLSLCEEKIYQLSQVENPTFHTLVTPFNDILDTLDQAFHPLSHYNGVKNTKVLQKTITKALSQLSTFHTTIYQNETLYTLFSHCSSSTEQEKKALTKILQDYELGGVGQPPAIKKEIAYCDEQLSLLENQFSQNVLDATDRYELLIENESDLGAMSESDKLAAKVEKEGKNYFRFTLKAPSFIPFMTYSPNRSLRETLYHAYTTRAPNNSLVLEQILSLRNKKAKLLGFSSYAELSTSLKDAQTPQRVLDFLENLRLNAYPFACKEYDELKKEAQYHSISCIMPYDTAFLSEIIRQRDYDVDEEQYRPYFEAFHTLTQSLHFFEKLFHINFKAITIKTWHPTVLVFNIEENDQLIGRLFIDLFARKGKRGGAWMDHFTTRCITSKNESVLPIAHIVCNFTPPTPQTPSLLRPSEIETLFHEMGHALHHLLSRSTISSLSGVNGVLWDVVEFPSQFLECFSYEEKVLQNLSQHYQTKDLLPYDMALKLKKAKNFHAALALLRQIEFSLFDILVHMNSYSADEAHNLLQTIRQQTALINVPEYNRFENSFTHIFAGGYAAGYYSYKWAEVLSASAFEALTKDSSQLLTLALSYRESVLAKGGEKSMETLYEEFTGEKIDPQALLRLYGLSHT